MVIYSDLMGYEWDIPSCNDSHSQRNSEFFHEMLNMVIFHSYVKLPEGRWGGNVGIFAIPSHGW